jgi:hypothetical protein
LKQAVERADAIIAKAEKRCGNFSDDLKAHLRVSLTREIRGTYMDGADAQDKAATDAK